MIPSEKVYQIRNGKKVSKERNFFPGYIGIQANLHGEIPHMIQKTTGSNWFLRCEKRAGASSTKTVMKVNRILGKVDELAESEEANRIYHSL